MWEILLQSHILSMGGDALRSLKDSLLTSPWRKNKESGSSLQSTSHLILGFSRDNLRVEKRNGLTANSVTIWTVNSRKKRQETERGNGEPTTSKQDLEAPNSRYGHSCNWQSQSAEVGIHHQDKHLWNSNSPSHSSSLETAPQTSIPVLTPLLHRWPQHSPHLVQGLCTTGSLKVGNGIATDCQGWWLLRQSTMLCCSSRKQSLWEKSPVRSTPLLRLGSQRKHQWQLEWQKSRTFLQFLQLQT